MALSLSRLIQNESDDFLYRTEASIDSPRTVWGEHMPPQNGVLHACPDSIASPWPRRGCGSDTLVFCTVSDNTQGALVSPAPRHAHFLPDMHTPPLAMETLSGSSSEAGFPIFGIIAIWGQINLGCRGVLGIVGCSAVFLASVH